MHHVFLPYILGVLSTLTIVVGAYAIGITIDDIRSANDPIVYERESEFVPLDTNAITVVPEDNTIEIALPSASSTEAVTIEDLSVFFAEAIAEEVGTSTKEIETEPIDVATVVEAIEKPQPEAGQPLAEKIEKEIIPFNEINDNVRDAIVNIFCTTKRPHTVFTPSSGSGVIIDPKGIILTSAHIADSLLVQDVHEEGFMNCFGRTGSPARAAYELGVLFISTEWIKDNPQSLIGQFGRLQDNDFALLYIKDSLIESPLPSSFPYIPLPVGQTRVAEGDDVLVAGYPAGFLGFRTLQKDLYAASAVAKINQVSSFEGDKIDLISVTDTILAQQGASGGPLLDRYGDILGIFTTTTLLPTTEGRELTAVSVAHIDVGLQEQAGVNLNTFLDLDPRETEAFFASTTVPWIVETLTSALAED